MSVILINTVADSFTPTLSGTTGIITWELCQAASRAGVEPLVIARDQHVPSYDWKNLVLLDWPYVPKSKVGTFLMRAQRKLTGWQHFREGAYCARLANVIRAKGLANMPMLLQNDVEPAVYLRQQFPKAFILHHFQNQQECRPQFRKRFAGAATVVTAVSSYTARWIESYYGLAKGSVKTVYNGVDVNRFVPANPPAPKPLLVNYIGRTGMEKAPDLVLKAALAVSKTFRDFRVQILGANQTGWVNMDAYQMQLKELSEELEAVGIPVRRPGFLVRADVPSEVRKAHIHITPSRWEEPFGIVTLEAMASGLATIASRTGGTPEFVGDAALLFTKDSVEELAAHLERFLTDEAARNEYARRGRLQAQEFTWDRTWREFSSLMPLSD
jgi:glycosyltransferase involved in cell wall biosynthesis